MKTKTPAWTYVITFLNPILPSFIMIALALCFVMVTTIDSDTKAVISTITFIEMYYAAVLMGLYLNLSVSLLYYYVIREGVLRPRWWMNLLLVLFAYGIIPLGAFLLGDQEVASNAQSSIGEKYGFIVLAALVGFIVITVSTKGKLKSGS